MNPEEQKPETAVVATENGSGGKGPECSIEPKYRRNGNVARLPKAVRDRINVMIQDGVTYGEIIERLGKDGEGLDISNLSRWKDGGFRDWEAAQAFIARTRARQETPGEMVRDFDGTEVNHAALQLGTLQIFEALKEIEGGSLEEKLGGDCAAFARLLNALARASRETMLVQKYRDACARARAALTEMKDPNRKLTESETRAIVRQVDNILGLRPLEEVTGDEWRVTGQGGGDALERGAEGTVKNGGESAVEDRVGNSK